VGQLAVPRAARRFKVDAIFNPKFSIPFFTRRMCVFVLQGADWYVNPQNYPWWDNLYIRLVLPLYCRKATRLLVISQATLDDLAKHTAIDTARATVTYAGVGENFNATADAAALAEFRARYQLPPSFMLTVARAYHSGHANAPPYPGGNNERLVRAYQRYRQQGGHLPLVVAGHRIDAYLRNRGFTDASLAGVQFIDFVPNVQMHLAYQLAECFVLATLCESFGLPILEAMSCGCPAIVPSTCASPEVAGGAARLIDPYDEADITQAMNEVCGSAGLRLHMRQRGLLRARAFTWEETARRTLAVFDEMFRARAPRRGAAPSA
jgi:glycosyltransferase involved in cell wall biosynthesis